MSKDLEQLAKELAEMYWGRSVSFPQNPHAENIWKNIAKYVLAREINKVNVELTSALELIRHKEQRECIVLISRRIQENEVEKERLK